MCEERLNVHPVIAMCTYDMPIIKIGRDLTNPLVTKDFIFFIIILFISHQFVWVYTIFNLICYPIM